MKTDGLDFPFKTSDVTKVENMNDLAINIFELQFYQEGITWKHKLIPIAVSEKNSETVIDLVIYKNHYALIKKLHVFLGNHNSKFICRRCLACFKNVLGVALKLIRRNSKIEFKLDRLREFKDRVQAKD